MIRQDPRIASLVLQKLIALEDLQQKIPDKTLVKKLEAFAEPGYTNFFGTLLFWQKSKTLKELRETIAAKYPACSEKFEKLAKICKELQSLENPRIVY